MNSPIIYNRVYQPFWFYCENISLSHNFSHCSHSQFHHMGTQLDEDITDDMADFKILVNDAAVKVARVEQELNLVEQFYSAASKKQANTPRGSLIVKERFKENNISNLKKRQQDPLRVDADARERMQELMHQLGDIVNQLTLHKWAAPFMQPVDVVGLGLLDYFQVIKKPMDFTTIKTKMEAKDGTGYKNVREIYADVRLVFKNAMKYNAERDDVHVKAKTMLAKFEEKWLQLLPKVDEEEERQKEGQAEELFEMQLAQEAKHVKMTKDISNKLHELDSYLEDLKGLVLQNCRKMSFEEKKSLSHALTMLPPGDLHSALMIVAQDNPNFQAKAEEVDLDIDAQSQSTLWRLKFFVKETMGQSKIVAGDENYNNHHNKRKSESDKFLAQTPQKKRRRQL